VTISFYNSLPPSTNVSDLCLAYIDEVTQEWLCESDITISDTGAIVGQTSHFTTFMVLGKVSSPHVNALTPEDFGNLGQVNKNTTGVYVVAGIFFVYLVGLVFTLRYDKRHSPPNISLDGGMGGDDIRSKHVGFSDFIDLADLPTTIEGPASPAPRKAGGEGASGSGSMKAPQYRSKLRVKERSQQYVKSTGRICMEKFREKHTWLAIFFARSGRFARTDMLTQLLCTILGNLVVNAIFYDRSGDVQLAQKIVIGLIVGSIMFPISIGFAILLSKLAGRFKIVGYVISITFCLGCAVLVIVYSLDFGDEKSNSWLTSFAVSSFQDCIANQPLKFLVTSFIVACCPTTWIAIIL